MSMVESLERDPAAIEADVHRTRRALDRKIEELERRLSPRHRWNELRASFDGTPLATCAALTAISVGAWMAIAGFRRYRFGSGSGTDDCEMADMMGE